MDKETRVARTLEALEHVAAELEKLRILREYEMGARVVDEEGSVFVRPDEGYPRPKGGPPRGRASFGARPPSRAARRGRQPPRVTLSPFAMCAGHIISL